MKIKHMEISFWRRKSRQEGKIQIYCRISVGGERIDIGSTGITTWHDHWDEDKKKFTTRDPEAFFKNEQLDIMRVKLRAIFTNLLLKEEKITPAKIRRAYEGQSTNVTLLSAFALYMKDSASDQERDLEESTLGVYDNVRKKLTTFLIKHKATDLLIEDFDLKWVKKFRAWMKKVPLDGGKVGHADSYIIKQTQTIKNVMIWSKLNKLADSNPLEGMRVKGPEWDDPVHLTLEQFEQLRAHKFENESMQHVADVFIILCRCGFHFGDLEDFVKQHRKAVKKGVDGNPWIIKERIKTQVPIRVPIFEEVEEIVTKYGGWEHLPMMSDQKFNGWLKLIAAEMKWTGELAEISSKAGRKTFTYWCFNTLLLSTDAVVVVLGRKSASGLEVYARPDEHKVAGELAQSREMQKRNKAKKKKNRKD